MPISSRDRDRNRQQHQNPNQNFTDIQNVATYQAPGILATLNGNPVRLVAQGDAPGHSPVCQYVDEDGHLNWAEQDQFTVIDSQFLPPSRNTLNEVLRAVNQQ